MGTGKGSATRSLPGKAGIGPMAKPGPQCCAVAVPRPHMLGSFAQALSDPGATAQRPAKRQGHVLRSWGLPYSRGHLRGPVAAWRAADREHSDPDLSLETRIREWLGGKLLKGRHWCGLRNRKRFSGGVVSDIPLDYLNKFRGLYHEL